MNIDTATPQTIAQALDDELQRHIDYLPVDPGGANRAAAKIAQLL